MISSSKPPSRWRMALALPALLAVMALACSKEQSAPAQITKRLTADNVKLAKITIDSLQVASGTGFKKVVLIGTTSKTQLARIVLDTQGSKAKLDLRQTEAITIEGKMTDDKIPPLPPQKVGPPGSN